MASESLMDHDQLGSIHSSGFALPSQTAPELRHAHTLSVDSVTSSFQYDGLPQSQTFPITPAPFEYSHPPSVVHSPVLSVFPSPPHTYVTDAQRDSVYSPQSVNASPSRSAFASDNFPHYAQGPMLAPSGESVPNEVFMTVDLLAMSLLEGIETAVRSARDAMASGDRASFRMHTESVVSSAKLLDYRHRDWAPMDDPEGLSLDNISLSSHSRPSMPSKPAPTREHAFAYGLALLDASDPSRKRTISAATARAPESDRAAKSAKRSPSRRQSVSYVEVPDSHGADGWASVQNNQRAYADDIGIMDKSEIVTGLVAPHQARLSAQYTPSPLARHGVRLSRSSSYSYPSQSSFGFDPSVKVESSQSSVVHSRPPSPESFFTESEVEGDIEPLSMHGRRSSHEVTDTFVAFSQNTIAGPSNCTSANPPPPPPDTDDRTSDMNGMLDVFLQQVCSNVDMKDPQGEAIHQPLMKKKMEKLEASTDFRPFKFRVTAFLRGFLAILAEHHLGEDQIPQKKVNPTLHQFIPPPHTKSLKVRAFLHSTPLIARYNEDASGKKSKSKGNFIWHVSAKKEPDGSWSFRPFERRIVGITPTLAYVGVKYHSQLLVWDPQMPSQSLHMTWSSENLPSWLTWRNNVLYGIPSISDVGDVHISIEASFPKRDQKPAISASFTIQVVPLTISDQLMKTQIPDTAAHTYSMLSDQTTAHVPSSSFADVTHALRIVTLAARNVADAQQSPPGPSDSMAIAASLARQQQVLVTVAEALSEATPSGVTQIIVTSASKVITSIAQAVLARDGYSMVSAEQKQNFIPDSHTVSHVASLLQAYVADVVGRDTATTELEVVLAVDALVSQQIDSGHIKILVQSQGVGSEPSLSHIPPGSIALPS